MSRLASTEHYLGPCGPWTSSLFANICWDVWALSWLLLTSFFWHLLWCPSRSHNKALQICLPSVPYLPGSWPQRAKVSVPSVLLRSYEALCALCRHCSASVHWPCSSGELPGQLEKVLPGLLFPPLSTIGHVWGWAVCKGFSEEHSPLGIYLASPRLSIQFSSPNS